MSEYKEGDVVDEPKLRANLAAARQRLDAAKAEETYASESWNAAHQALAAGLRGRFPREDELTYALGVKCDGCGALMAYQPEIRPNAWDCSEVLLGRVGTPEDKALVFTKEMGSAPMPEPPVGKVVHTRLPFWCWKVKSDPARSRG